MIKTPVTAPTRVLPTPLLLAIVFVNEPICQIVGSSAITIFVVLKYPEEFKTLPKIHEKYL